MKFYLLLCALLAAAPWMSAQPAQVILIRHAEKPADPAVVHLSQAGERRAKDLVHFLLTDSELTKHGAPVALYATETTKHGHGQRTQETISPLAKEVHLSIKTPYRSEDYQKLARDILADRKYHGKTVLICWTHEFIPQFAAALGVHPQPPKWKEDVYDRVYLISYQDGQATLKNLRQRF